MVISKKQKRTLLILLPAAGVVIAALILWLLLGQSRQEPPFEILRSQTTGTIVDCQLREGAVETGDGSTPQPYYTLTPPQGWTQTEEARILYSSSGEASPDVFQSQEGVEMSFSQGRSAVLGLGSLDPATIQEVQFGDNQVIYSQSSSTGYGLNGEEELRSHTEVFWVHGQSLLNLSCYQAMDLNQMLEWVTLVNYENPRMLAYEPPPIQPLELVRGGVTQETGIEYYRSEGNPEIPENVPSYTFPQAPEGWTLLGGDTIQPGKTLEKYQNQEGEVLALLVTTGPATLFENETGTTHFYLPFTGMSWAERADQSSVQDATVNGSPAFVHITEEVSEIAWIDGCCTLQIRSTAPLTQEELVALAESVQGEIYYEVQGG